MTTPYAPTYNSSNDPTASINLDEEVKLYSKARERELYESLAEMYSIIVSLEFLEKAYIKDTITQAQYTPICQRLLAQYKTILKNSGVAAEFVDLDTFKHRYKISFPTATERLRIGVPATVEQAVGEDHSPTPSTPKPQGSSARAVAEATQNFITFMDALNLNYKAKDQLHPLLSNVMTTLNRVTTQAFDGREKIVHWLITLNQMRATDEISEDQSRQMLFDIENAYNEYLGLL